MIAWVSGKLGEAFAQSCIVRTSGGVGYRLKLPAHTFAALPPAGADVAFYASMSVREDAIELYGFETFAEREAFDVLRGVNKVGPRAALAILAAYRPEDLLAIVREENQQALIKVPGIGPKTAQQILLELRYKLGARARAEAGAPAPKLPAAQADTMAALGNLGYAAEECLVIVQKIFAAEPDLDAGSAIRLALKELAKGKA